MPVHILVCPSLTLLALELTLLLSADLAMLSILTLTSTSNLLNILLDFSRPSPRLDLEPLLNIKSLLSTSGDRSQDIWEMPQPPFFEDSALRRAAPLLPDKNKPGWFIVHSQLMSHSIIKK
ncbi:unnamed protein product [Cyclocybe aegerita]|uniref:Uncharacterized protein n=1 Tax=Cyclocybe aegerita TaxID=1973307 RepID=A0A8S0W607_CYCAE|nr:unnamed protein product [Cyclocybe aegerita]